MLYFQIILSAFFGGLFAGLFSNFYESKRRISDKRRDKYYDHRNTMVQIEHELLPARVSISRNIVSLDDSLKNTNKTNKRIILRFFKLKLSSGLSLNILNLDLINLYAKVFSQFEIINNDIDYIDKLASSIIEDNKNDRLEDNLIDTYFQFSEHLLSEIKKADKISLKLVSHCKLIFSKSEDDILKNYLKKGGLIKYRFMQKTVKKISDKLSREETKSYKKGEIRPTFIAPFLDLKKVPI